MRKKKVRDDTLGPVMGTIFLVLLGVGLLYTILGPLFWMLLFVVIVVAVLAGINWLFSPYP